MAPLPVTCSHLIGHFCCLKPFYLEYCRKYSVYHLWCVFTWIGKRMWFVISTMPIFSKTKDFSGGHSQSYLYYKIALSRVAGGRVLSHRSHAIGDWTITVNSGRSHHSSHTTAKWGGRGVAAACVVSSRTVRCVHRCPQWWVQAIKPHGGVMACTL